MTGQLHIRARKFLQEFFNDEDLTNFCFDYFPQVYSDFTQGMPKSQKVRMLVEHNQRRDRFDELLAALERERPKSYPDHFAEQPHLIGPEPQPEKEVKRNPRQIFISHAHQDGEFAQRLAVDLREKGWQTWMAPDNIQPGEKWVEAINRGLSESGVFVLLLTPDAVDSRWVTSEMNVAIGMEHREEMRLLPLNLKPAATPAFWQAYQWIGFDGNYDSGLMALLNVLESRKVTSTEPINTKLPSRQKSPVKPKEEVDSSPQRTFNERIKTVPSYWFYAGGGFILLFVLLVILWPDATINSVVEPTVLAEEAIIELDEAHNKPASELLTMTIESIQPSVVITPSPASTSCTEEDQIYVMQLGDTFSGIATQYEISAEDLMSYNKISSGPYLGQEIMIPPCEYTVPTPTLLSRSCFEEELLHVVQSGEALSGIVTQYGIPAEEIIFYNELPNILLEVDQEIKIPPCEYIVPTPLFTNCYNENRIHIVQVGESLFRIARNYSFNVEVFAEFNNIDPNVIDVGQVLFIPCQ